jgi:hypothetical protein
LADFSFVTLRVATGAAINDASDVNALVSAGITHVIDCRWEFDDVHIFADHPYIVYLYNGVLDDGFSKPDSWFAKSLSFALPALAMPHVKIYAHCAAGVNRGPSTAYAILRAQGFDAITAERQIRIARPQVRLAYKSDADRAVLNLGYD